MSKSFQFPDKVRGFTLLEVLISGLILFVTISSATLIYRNALFSSQKAEEALVLNGYMPFAVEEIEQKIRGAGRGPANLNGEGRILNIDYVWNARRLRAEGALPRLDSNNKLVEQVKRYTLWEVTLTMRFGSSQEDYVYQELSF